MNVTQTSQLNPWDNEAFPQKLFIEKSPVIVTLLTEREDEPTYLMFTSVVVPVAPTATEPKLKLVGVSATVEEPEEPAPVPLRAMDCGLPEALSVMVTEPVRVPAAVGVKVTLMLQLPVLAAKELPQLLLCAKLVLFAPVTPMFVMLNAALPVFMSVTDCDPLVVFNAWLAKITLELERLTAGAGVPPLPPVPRRVMDCGLPEALSVIVTEAVRVPFAVGLNVTLMVQFPLLADNEFPQLLVCA
jgi:hypothetical protein